MHILAQDGVLWRTLPCPIPPGQRHRLQGVRLAGPGPLPEPGLAVQRRVFTPGRIQRPPPPPPDCPAPPGTIPAPVPAPDNSPPGTSPDAPHHAPPPTRPP